MTQDAVARLYKREKRFELVYPEYGLSLRAPYAEWVLEAAAEIVGRIEKLKVEGAIEELELLGEFAETDDVSVQIDCLKYENGNRFEVVPQCLVTLGDMDYRWVSQPTRNAEVNGFGERLHDMSLTRNNSYLEYQK